MSEEDENIIITNGEYGKQMYFEIQKQRQKHNPNSTYVWFEKPGAVERMWVQVLKGNRKEGSGLLINSPVKLTDLKYGYYVEYETGEDKITFATEVLSTPFIDELTKAAADRTVH